MPLAFPHSILAIKWLISHFISHETSHNAQQSQVPRRDVNPPISTLPNELLVEIFMITVAIVDPKDRPFTPFSLSHVCRHWKEVAIHAPLLWADLTFVPRDHECVVALLERSDPVDLRVVLSLWIPRRTVQAIMDYMPRVGFLYIDCSWATLQVNRRLSNRPLQTAFRLKELTVEGENHDLTTLLECLQLLEQLRDLRLFDAHFDWSIFPLRSLTYLSLRRTTASSLISIQTLTTILGQMPLLEVLALTLNSNVVNDNASPTLQPLRIILPALWSLDLGDSTVDLVVDFLTHTASPRLRDATLAFHLPPTQRLHQHDNYPRLLNALTTTVLTGNFGAFDHLSFWSDILRLAIAKGPNTSPYHIGLSHDPNPRLPYLALDILTRNKDFDCCAQLTEDLLELTSTPIAARIVHLQLEFGASAHEFERLLSMPCCLFVQKITIDGPTPLHIAALTRILAVNGTAVPFAHLNAISMGTRKWGFVEPAIWKPMCDCFALRRRAGFPLEEFALGNSSVTPEQYAYLTRFQTADWLSTRYKWGID